MNIDHSASQDPSTPSIDNPCICPNAGPLLLCMDLSDNPIKCMVCKGTLDHKAIGIDDSVKGDALKWNSLYRALYILWIDSNEYESWALEKLADPKGRVNKLGFEIIQQLSSMRKAFYWWSEAFAGDVDRDKKCPNCGNEWETDNANNLRICCSCQIASPL